MQQSTMLTPPCSPKVNPLLAVVTSVAELGKGNACWDSVTEMLNYMLEQLNGGTRSLLLALPQRQ